jgi:hypothetical protein
VDERLGEAKRYGPRGTGGGNDPEFARESDGIGDCFPKAIVLRPQIHRFIERTRTVAMFPGVFGLRGRQSAIAGGQDNPNVRSRLFRIMGDSRVAESTPRGSDRIKEIGIFVILQLLRRKPVRCAEIFQFSAEVAAEMFAVKTGHGNNPMPTRPKRFGHGGSIVANRAE